MNILLFFVAYPSTGGTEGVMTYMANGFVKRGHSVTICSCAAKIPGRQPLLDERVACTVLPSTSTYCRENVECLHRLIEEKEIQMVINNFSLSGGVRLCDEARCGTAAKLFTIHHGNIYPLDTHYLVENMRDARKQIYRAIFPLYKAYKNAMMYLLHWYNIRHSDAYVLLAKSYLHHFHGNKKVTFVNNAILLPEVKPANGTEKENIVLYVGRLMEYQKRITLSLDIWKKVASSHPDWKYVIVGDGGDREMIEKYIVEHDIPRVILEGRQAPLSYYQRAKIMLVTSSSEGWPLVINESKSAGCVPMAFLTYECLPELINDGKDGFVLKEGDVEGYARKLALLMENENMRERMAASAIEASANYSQDAIMDKWEQLISKYF